VSEDIENFAMNTAISSMMILVNEMEKVGGINEKDFKIFLQILAPFAPHIAEELWHSLGDTKGKSTYYEARNKSIHLSRWPKWDKKKIIEDNIKIIIQINGKVRSEIVVSKDIEENEIKSLVLKDKKVIEWVGNSQIKRFIYVKGRIVNIVV